MRGIGIEIVDHLCARGIGRVVARHRQARQARMIPVGVQMQAVIMLPPRRADGVRLLQHRHVNPAARIVAAQASPAGPAPMMMASEVEFVVIGFRHCERSEAIQSSVSHETLDCFVALLLAMTTRHFFPHTSFAISTASFSFCPLLLFGEDVALLGRGEAALRRQRELVERRELRGLVEPPLDVVLLLQRAALGGDEADHDDLACPWAGNAAARGRRRARCRTRGNSRRSWCRPAWLGHRLVAARRDPGRAEITAADVRGDGHVGRLLGDARS